jgi:hypothetical protein
MSNRGSARHRTDLRNFFRRGAQALGAVDDLDNG